MVGLFPILALTFLYGVKTNWRATVAGRAVFYLMAVTTISYLMSVLVLLFPEWFVGSVGEFIRVATRVAIAGVFWNLLRLFILAQRSGTEVRERGAQGALENVEAVKAYISQANTQEIIDLMETVKRNKGDKDA